MIIWQQYAHWHQTLIPVPTTIKKKGICRDGPKICGFYTAEVIQETEERYHRQPRWYEKYIK